MATTYFVEAGSTEFNVWSTPVYNMVPQTGVAAEFGYIVARSAPILLETSVRTGTDYGLTTNVSDINQALVVAASKVTIWGVPSARATTRTAGGACAKSVPIKKVSAEAMAWVKAKLNWKAR